MNGREAAGVLLAALCLALSPSGAPGQSTGKHETMRLKVDGAELNVEIDGAANRQACMVEVREGMAVRPMHGARTPVAESSDD